MDDIEALPEGLLLWRSLTHWIGGMGIIVLAIAILPLLGIGGMQLFAAEAPGPSTDKLHPRITDTAKRLWLIYVGYTSKIAAHEAAGRVSMQALVVANNWAAGFNMEGTLTNEGKSHGGRKNDSNGTSCNIRTPR